MIQGVLMPLSCASVEHYTPGNIVEAARATMGGIDLDPFSCELANRSVRATEHYSLANGRDGFVLPWTGRVFCNPPGGKVGRESSQSVAWVKLMMERAAGRVTAGVYVCFNLGFLQTSQGHGRGLALPLDFPICYPASRVDYLVDHLPDKKKPSAKQVADFETSGLCEGGRPTGASCIVLVPPRDELSRRRMEARFVAEFEAMGKVVIPR